VRPTRRTEAAQSARVLSGEECVPYQASVLTRVVNLAAAVLAPDAPDDEIAVDFFA
jgi:hypothetical protein